MIVFERLLILVALQVSVPVLWYVQRGRWRFMKPGEWFTRAGYIALAQASAFSTGTFLLASGQDLAAWRLPGVAAASLLVLTGSVFRLIEDRAERAAASNSPTTTDGGSA